MVNIFETMEKTSRRIEPFHSQFLADVMQASSGGDRSLSNRKWALDKADDLATVREFDRFQAKYPDARHISWLDIAAIPWNGNELWRQHRLYVYQRISPLTKLHPSEESVTALWGNLSELGIPVSGWRLNRQRSNDV